MEQSEEFKDVQAKLKALEDQLALCDQAKQECEQSGKDAVKDIEDQFAKYLNALAARKAVLLREVEQKVTNQSTSLLFHSSFPRLLST